MLMRIQNRKLLGTLLVGLQFASMLVLPVLAWPALATGNISKLAVACAATSLALLMWTLTHNRIGNFNIRPVPKGTGVLVTTGPYRWIRHPMYTAVLLAGASLAATHPTTTGWVVEAFLTLVLLIKSSIEEQWMCEQYPDYPAYIQTTKRLLPWIF